MATWSKIISEGPDVYETWECDRFFNPRGTLHVWVYKGRRYRTDNHKQTSEAALKADLWKRVHRMENGR